MSRRFNVNGVCYPDEHYMVNIDSKLAEIKELVDEKQYFVKNIEKTLILWEKEVDTPG